MNKIIALTAAFALLFGCAAPQVREARPAAAPSTAREAETAPPAPRETPPGGEAAEGGETRAFVPVAAPRPAPSPPQAPPPPPGPAGEEKYVSLNFDNAEVGLVLQTIAELIGLSYIVAPGVSGRVTIQSSTKIPVSSLFAVLEEILEVNSLTAVKSGDFYKIVPTAQARQKDIETVIEGGADVPPGQQVITRVVPLSFISPTEVVKVLNPLKTAAGVYFAHEPARLLFMTDTAKKIAEMMKIVELLDVDGFAQIQVELYPVKFADAEDLSRDLTQVVTTVFSAGGRGRALFKIIPVTQINALMIISGEPGLSQNIISWVTKMDQPAKEASEQIFVYPLAHAKAEEIASVLSQVFSKERSKGASVPAAPEAPVEMPAADVEGGQRQTTPPPVVAAAPGTAVTRSGAGGVHAVTLVADKATNSLVIQTASWYYPVVEETIRKLDMMPRQVLIEVLIAEITLDDETRFGLQWALRGQGAADVFGEQHNVSSQIKNVYSADGGVALPGTGFSWVITEANRITAALNAYARDAKLNVLSSPHIMATDNVEATINVGDEVPIVRTQTTETAGSTGTLAGTVTNDVEYRDTGVLLTVTPHINEGRYVTMDIRQEVSQAQTNTLGGSDSPIIRKRTAQTTMVVRDNQTLVIGGLMDESKDRSREGLPFLSKIPVLGYLFGSTVDKISKTELVLLITPRVITTPEEGNQVSRMIRDRVLTLKEGIDLFTDMPKKEGRGE